MIGYRIPAVVGEHLANKLCQMIDWLARMVEPLNGELFTVGYGGVTVDHPVNNCTNRCW